MVEFKDKASIPVSKLDAARRQLNTAIQLFFYGGDVVSLHTLTCAAYEVLSGLNRVKPMLQNNTLVKEEYQKEYIDKLREAQNFFKHGSSDPYKSLEFNSEQTELLLWDAVRMYQEITKEEDFLRYAFEIWIYAKIPQVLTDQKQRKVIESLSKTTNFRDRISFLNLIREVWDLQIKNR